ncbi:HNH endonuclease [Comamonas humi]
MSAVEKIQKLKPQAHKPRVYDLLKQTGMDMHFWEYSQVDGSPIEPSENTFQASKWNYGLDKPNQPLVACMWWIGLKEIDGHLGFEASIGQEIKEKSDLLSKYSAEGNGKSASRMRNHLSKLQDFTDQIYRANKTQEPIRIIFIDGKEILIDGEQERQVDFRSLDTEPWYVHHYNPLDKSYRMLRSIKPAPRVIDPFNGEPDSIDSEEIQAIQRNGTLSETEKEQLIKARVGQGYFRDQLMRRWEGCALGQVKSPTLLIASHIKPWSKCENKHERLSPDNGILLNPSFDKLFDSGLISFDEQNRFKILVSSSLKILDMQAISLTQNMYLRAIDISLEGMKPFMEYHRKYIFKG